MFFAYVSDDFKQKKIPEEKNRNFLEKIVNFFFLTKLFFIFLEFPEMHSDLVASKIGEK